MQAALVMRKCVFEATVFLFKNTVAVLCGMLLPFCILWALLYVFFSAYLAELTEYLFVPGDREASRLLGLAAAAFLVPLLFEAAVVSNIGEVAMGLPVRRGLRLGFGRSQIRIYAATLRLFLSLMVGLAVVYGGLYVWLAAAGRNPHLLFWGKSALISCFLAAGWAASAVQLFFVPVAVAEHGSIVRRSIGLAVRGGWPLAGTSLLLLLATIGMQTGVEYLLQADQIMQLSPHLVGLAQNAAQVENVLPQFLAAAAFTCFIGIPFYVVCGVFFYRALAGKATGG
jgi:hypothetical protein